MTMKLGMRAVDSPTAQIDRPDFEHAIAAHEMHAVVVRDRRIDVGGQHARHFTEIQVESVGVDV